MRELAKKAIRLASGWIIRRVGTEATAILSSRRTVVVAPHPDDETFGCGATIARLRAAGVDVHLLVVTDGGESPRPAGVSLEQMIVLRQEETIVALAALGVERENITFWDYADGDLPAHRADLTDRLTAFLSAQAPEQVMVTSALDRHPDHAVVGLAARDAVGRLDSPPVLLEYPVWQRVQAFAYLRRHREDVGGTQNVVSRSAVLCASGEFLTQKKSAIAAYESQLPHFPAGFVDDFLQPFEHFATSTRR
ncbi:MAG: PIG-L family deacetylase [Microbacterium sp.]|nr:PIG-L family deacetylase [Microbacterium sp.]